MFDVAIANEQDSLDLDCEFLCAVTRAVLQSEQVNAATISIAIVNDKLMHELNRRHLDHDYPTDVLSFLLHSETSPENSLKQLRLDGEVIVSADTALREAASRGVPASEEVALYLVHGLLHLCGYDDQNEADRDKMRAREQIILAQFKILPTYD